MIVRGGMVALVHHNSNGSNEEVNGNVYLFRPQYAISMAWVKEQDVPALLAKRVKGCCGITPPKYAYASERQVKVYETGGY